MKTIAQISTPLGSGGIAIVRVSGDAALDIGFKLFSAKNLTRQNIEPRKLYLGKLDLGGANEKCMMVYFKAPFSFTGEDVVEFQIHGGEYLASKVLSRLLGMGASLAENGEFSKRAFMNGKMSLDEAEATIDMINATSDAEIRASGMLAGGKMTQKVHALQQKLMDMLTKIEVCIDYPEHDDEELSVEYVREGMREIQKEINELVFTYPQGERIKSGINVAIVGKPNVGKSSLLNSLLGEDRAIVTEIEGTTRDTLKETINHKGFKINIIDTAGIRDSDDVVEKIGVNRSKAAIENADIVLFVMDASAPLTKEDHELESLLDGKITIKILNKCDKKIMGEQHDGLFVSALTGENVEQVKDEIIRLARLENVDFSQLVLLSRRHYEILKEAQKRVESILSSLDKTMDIVDIELKSLYLTLGKITGESEAEEIINQIFARFCLGK